MKRISLFSTHAGAAMLVSTVLGLAGCHSGAVEQRDLMVEDLTAGERPVAMKGEGAFLDGRLLATVTVSRGFNRGGRNGGEARGGRSRRSESSDVYSDSSIPMNNMESEAAEKEAMEAYVRLVMAQRAAGSPMPPVTLRLSLENHGTEPLDLAVTEVNSELGNFAVRPEKLQIAPGASGTLDPMISQLGVSSDEIAVKVTVRVDGKTETHPVVVKSVLTPAAKK